MAGWGKLEPFSPVLIMSENSVFSLVKLHVLRCRVVMSKMTISNNFKSNKCKLVYLLLLLAPIYLTYVAINGIVTLEVENEGMN